jgi:hypothetical protein
MTPAAFARFFTERLVVSLLYKVEWVKAASSATAVVYPQL